MSENTLDAKTSPLGRWGLIGLAILILLGVVVVLFSSEDTVDVSRSRDGPPPQIVSVLDVSRAKAEARVSVFAELRPRWNAEIRAAVSGRILQVHDAALAGTRVAAGEILFEIENSQYKTAVASAELALEQALLARLRADNNVVVARKQFSRDGITPPNDLALNLPDLRIAEHAVTSAQAQLAAAQQQLADTVVTAPFSGFITDRLAGLGQTVSVGEGLVTLSDDREFELMVELSQSDWALLSQPIAGTQAQLYHRDGKALGAAHIRQGGGFLDPKTRQVRVFLEVSDPAKDVLAGDFLRVEFQGRVIEDTLTLPETTLTRAGHIWMVDQDNSLVRVTPEILFRSGNSITIAAPGHTGTWLVAKTPLASFLPGQRVAPQPVEG
jgi:RND family efflux transporter MFP subunit